MIRSSLSQTGICYVSCQKYYYGVGGGSDDWMDFVGLYKEFEISELMSMNDEKSVDRLILKMNWIPGVEIKEEITEILEDTSNDFLQF